MTQQCNWAAHFQLDSLEPFHPNILTESPSLPDARLTRGCRVAQTVKLCRLPPKLNSNLGQGTESTSSAGT